MVEFMMAGGWSMWIVLIFGLATLVAAAVFVFRRDLGKLALVRALTLATVFAVCTGLCANVAAVMTHAAGRTDIPVHVMVMQGLAESLAPGILGFTMLSVGWLLVAVGTRRAQDRME
jgi:hypothetical protein